MRPLLLAAAFLAVPLPARAADPLHLSAVAGFGGTTGRAGSWTPVTVELENTGPLFTGSVVVQYAAESGHGLYAEPVELATGARKRVTCFVRPRAGPADLEVSLEDQRDRVRAGPEQVQLTSVEDDTLLVGVVSMGSRADPGLRTLSGRDVRLLSIEPEDLPAVWAPLSALDALVLREPDLSRLGPDRVSAMKAWVSAGGLLVVTGSEKWRSFDDPSFSELLPVRITGVTTVNTRTALPGWFLAADGQVAMVTSELVRGKVSLASAPGAPVAAEGRYGLGRVVFLAVEPGALPGLPDQSKQVLWSSLLRLPGPVSHNPGYAYPYGYQTNGPVQLIEEELSRIPPLKPPSVALVTLLIILYVLVVGPGDYFLLKRLGKLHWTWLTYPGAIAVFSGLIYAYARLSRSSDMMIRTISLVDVPEEPSGAPEPVRVFGGVYSPRAGRFQVQVTMPGTIPGSFAAANPFSMGSGHAGESLTRGGAHPSLDLTIPLWSMAGVDFAGETFQPPPFLVGVAAGGVIEVTNTSTRHPLEYVGLLWNGSLLDGGRVEPGAMIKLSPGNRARPLTEVPQDVQKDLFSKETEDFGRLVAVLAYATDPPFTRGEEVYGLPQRTRRPTLVERPRSDRGKPVVLAAVQSDPPIAVSGVKAAGTGLTVWRREVSGTGWQPPRRSSPLQPTAPDEDDQDSEGSEGMTP